MAIELTPQLQAMTDARFAQQMAPAERKRIRLEYGTSQAQLAAVLECDRQTIIGWEKEGPKGQTPAMPLAAKYGEMLRFMIVEAGKKQRNRRTPHTPK